MNLTDAQIEYLRKTVMKNHQHAEKMKPGCINAAARREAGLLLLNLVGKNVDLETGTLV